MGKILNKNKKANFNYTIVEKFTSGIVLSGSEVKSIKNLKLNMDEAYCYISNGEIFIKNMHISPHETGGKFNNHEPLRERKLLLNKKEIRYLSETVGKLRMTIIPLSIFLTNTGFIKMEIALAKGKKDYDKRNSLKLKEAKKTLKNV